MLFHRIQLAMVLMTSKPDEQMREVMGKRKHLKAIYRPTSSQRLPWCKRDPGGSILVLGMVLVLPMVMLFCLLLRIELLSTAAQRGQTAAESASLAAAADLSKIVVNDPYYGFIALSDYGPYGKATQAADGEPLPVLGINSIIATARLQTLIADELNNDELKRLAREDAQAARQAAKLLSDALNASLDLRSNYKARDLDGNIVRPFDDAKQVYLANLSSMPGLGKPELVDFHLSLGWLQNGSNSNTKAPLPETLSAMQPAQRMKGNYRAFIDIPACGESFYFAGLSQQPTLADTRKFIGPDGKRLCSIIRVDANLKVNGLDDSDNSGTNRWLHTAACAQPPSLPDMSTPGILALSFSNGLVPGIGSIQDIFDNAQLNENEIDVQTAAGGDFPLDAQSKLLSAYQTGSASTIARTFATGFHDWLRSAHSKVRIDSVEDAVSAPFADCARVGSGSRQSPNLFYELDSDGRVRISNLRQSPFYEIDANGSTNQNHAGANQLARECVYENQNYAVSYDAITAGGYSWMMVYRNYARTLGTIAGGKHAGELFPGDPVDWCELSSFDSDLYQAFRKGKGAQALRLQVNGQSYCQDGVMLQGAYFTKQDGNLLSHQPRRSQYSGGLAVYFGLSSPLPPDLVRP
jgi:hypothetical protein